VENNIREKLKEEKGAVTLLVFVTVLTFAAILLGTYLTVTTLQGSQAKSDIKIQEIYGRDVNRVDEIYEELAGIDKEKPTCQITYNVEEDESISYQFVFNEDIKDFTLNDVKIYNATTVNTGFENTLTLSTSSPAFATNLTQNKTYVVSFDYQCVSGTQEFEMGLYSETATNLPTNTLTAKEELQHEEYLLRHTSEGAQFKILAEIQESNNVTLTNVQIVEIEETEAEKGYLEELTESIYTLLAEYNSESKYVIMIEEESFTDLNGNPNKEIIKTI